MSTIQPHLFPYLSLSHPAFINKLPLACIISCTIFNFLIIITMAPKSSSTSKKKSSSTKDDGEVKEKPVKIPDLFIVRPQGETQAAVTHNKNIYKVGLHPKILEALGLNNNEFVSVYREGDRGVGGTVCAIPEAVEDPDLVDINVVTVSAGLKDAGALLFGDRVKVERYKTKMDMASLVSVRINTPNSPEQAVIDATTTDLKKLAMVSPGLSMEVKIESGEYVNVTVTDVGDTDLGSLSLEQSELKNHVSYWSPLFLLEDTQVVVSTRNCWELPKTTTYKSIGGLDQHIVELKSTIELPLHHPSLFSRFGISPPRGVLLHGPLEPEKLCCCVLLLRNQMHTYSQSTGHPLYPNTWARPSRPYEPSSKRLESTSQLLFSLTRLMLWYLDETETSLDKPSLELSLLYSL